MLNDLRNYVAIDYDSASKYNMLAKMQYLSVHTIPLLYVSYDESESTSWTMRTLTRYQQPAAIDRFSSNQSGSEL